MPGPFSAWSLNLERETGIEPATNSLEGCDSTTELLPPIPAQNSYPESQSRVLVAREGLEPSKPLGRQIYSLLRLTASLPRQLSVCWKRDVSGAYLRMPMELAKGFEPPTG